jgi:hypothetical protein
VAPIAVIWQPPPVSVDVGAAPKVDEAHSTLASIQNPAPGPKPSGQALTASPSGPVVNRTEDLTWWPPKPPFSPLTAVSRAALFGRFTFTATPTPYNPELIDIDPKWVASNIVEVEIPQLRKVLSEDHWRKVRFHRLGVERLRRLFAAWEEAGLINRIRSFDGTFVPRFVRGSRSLLSAYAWGTSFSINAGWNGLGATPAAPTQTGSNAELVPLANGLGFYWGGHFAVPSGAQFELTEVEIEAP